jgi:hypothetical protein
MNEHGRVWPSVCFDDERRAAKTWLKNQIHARKKMVQKKSLISKGTTIKADDTKSNSTPSTRPAVKPSVHARVAAAQKMAIKSNLI